MTDRYLKAVLTLIALELLWLAAIGSPRPVQAQGGPARVIIAGVALDAPSGALPVDVKGLVTIVPAGPLKIEADRPLRVESVPYTPSPRPGE
jgi:hypothetical protein